MPMFHEMTLEELEERLSHYRRIYGDSVTGSESAEKLRRTMERLEEWIVKRRAAQGAILRGRREADPGQDRRRA